MWEQVTGDRLCDPVGVKLLRSSHLKVRQTASDAGVLLLSETESEAASKIVTLVPEHMPESHLMYHQQQRVD